MAIQTLYHYTVGLKLRSIFAEGHLRLAPRKPRYPERGVVWLSANPTYELSALKVGMTPDGVMTVLTLEQMRVACQGLYRFVVAPAALDLPLYPWEILKTRARIKDKVRATMLRTAGECGANFAEWFGVMAPLPVDNLPLEIMEGGVWRAISPAEALGQAAIDDGTRILQATMSQMPAGRRVPEGGFVPGAIW
ncbi:MAG: hypothetical protein CVV05_00380 [Gammaproteobacteria bacterium HGW-Gammaproteobacteria-1]|jgi:hypothetical protein|nr:MAG: hypothetical protein CVV05_00380 [Gammaproteobacteria bacterium HGW-Gammaproteobacteria-1]